MAERSVYVPLKSADAARDSKSRYYELQDWFVEQVLGVLPIIGEEQFWYGTDVNIPIAQSEWNNQVYELIKGADVNPADFEPEFQINGVNLEWRARAVDPWINLGRVVGFDGVTPVITVSAETLAPGSNATAGIVDNHITFGIPRGDTGAAGASGGSGGLYEIPEATTEDQMCRAAAVLADVLADRLQDNLELIDFATTVTFQTADALLDGLSGFIPIGVPTVSAVLEFLHESITEPVIDFARENAYDLQARALARDQIFCAMQLAGDYTDFWSHIAWDESLPIFDYDFSDPLKSTWENFDDWLTWLANTANGTNAGWLVLAWGYFVSATIDHLVDLDNSVKNMVAYALNTASARDAEICNDCGFEWEEIFDFTVSDGGWVARSHSPTTLPMATYNAGVGWQYADVVSAPTRYRYCHIIRSFDTSTLTYAEAVGTMAYDAGGDASFKLIGFWKWSPSQLELVREDAPDALPVEWNGSNEMTGILFNANISARPQAQAVQGHITLTQITLRGLGENPFET